MNPTAKIQHKGQVTIPTRLRTQAGLAKGDLVEFSYQRGRIVITPKVLNDRDSFPNADDEYTPEQRMIVDAQLREAENGPFHGPFDTADGMIAHMKKELKRTGTSKKLRSCSPVKP